jgi:hypothetical protein
LSQIFKVAELRIADQLKTVAIRKLPNTGTYANKGAYPDQLLFSVFLPQKTHSNAVREHQTKDGSELFVVFNAYLIPTSNWIKVFVVCETWNLFIK